MDDSVPPPSVAAVLAEAAAKDQLAAFRARHPGRIAADVSNIHDLKQKITQTLADLRHGRAAEPTSAPDTTPIPPPDRCFGRNDETNRIVAALTAGTNPTAVLVQGPGGIGKTTLTREAANHQSIIDRFGHRRWFVELETAADHLRRPNPARSRAGRDPGLRRRTPAPGARAVPAGPRQPGNPVGSRRPGD
jgi:hypothetical protein